MKAHPLFALAALCATSLVLAQTGKPYQSTFQDYRPYADGTAGDWRAVNQSVSTAQAGAAHDHGSGKDTTGGHDHGSAPGGGGSSSHDHGGAGLKKGMDHEAMQRMHKGMDDAAMKKMHERHMRNMHGGGDGGHEGHSTPEKRP